MPKVSIILTSYNHEKYICEAIDSVLRQTFSDFELIIWDDASIDTSWQLINRYDDKRIKVFRNEINKGPVFGINKVISEIAIGDYIAIHHSDDVWEYNKLEKQVDFLENNTEIGAVFSDALAINEYGSALTETHFYSHIFKQVNRSRYDWLRFFFAQGNALCHPSLLIRKQCYQDCGLYRPLLAQLPDFDMWIRLCLKHEIYVLPDRLVRFRVHAQEANTSGSRPETRIRWRYEYYKILSNYQTLSSFKELLKVFPYAKKYDKGDITPVNFALAMMVLEQKTEPFITLFAEDVLFQTLSDQKQAELIKQLYNFDNLSFIGLVAQHDVFSLEKTVCDHERIILTMQNSLSWKITAPLRKLNTAIQLIAKLPWSITKWRKWRLFETEQFHLAPPNNYCFSVPFNCSITKIVISPTIAVICHLYYVELLEEFKNYLHNIPFTFDLFITTDTIEKKNIIANGLPNWQKGAVDIRVVPNRGRDIAPKLVACHDVYDRYEFFLHIHSKKSPHAKDVTAGWRTYLLDTLLGSEQIVMSIFAAFASDPKLGMIAPEHFDPIRDYVGWGNNFVAAKNFSRRLNIQLSLKGKIDFPSGSMFWGRSAAIQPLLALNLNTVDFPPEEQQIDTTLAHVIERLYFFICEKAGYRWIKIALPSLLKKADKMLIVEKETLFINAIESSQDHLLISNIQSFAQDKDT